MTDKIYFVPIQIFFTGFLIVFISDILSNPSFLNYVKIIVCASSLIMMLLIQLGILKNKR